MAVYTFFFLISLSTRSSILATDKICSATFTANKDDCAKARTFIPYTGPADNQVFDSKDVEKGKSGTCRISVSSKGDAANASASKKDIEAAIDDILSCSNSAGIAVIQGKVGTFEIDISQP
ncbi:hypothetical protein PGTUg99_028904 [Puccinia graminis f. sp. tritici]|nr:hypothetical protein PGTUg99_028904 [Puccinia graminis f. sp. tritici]